MQLLHNMSVKDNIKKIIRNYLASAASSFFIDKCLSIIDESADSRESFLAAADKIRKRITLFVDENLAAEVFAVLKIEIEKRVLIPGKRRKHERVSFRTKVNVTYAGKVYELYSTNLSEGGIHIEIKEPFPVGSQVAIALSLKGGSLVSMNGVVANTKRDVGIHLSGMGIQFEGVTDNVRTALKSIIDSAVKHDSASIKGTEHNLFLQNNQKAVI